MKELNFIRKLSSKILFKEKSEIVKILSKEIKKDNIYKYYISESENSVTSIKILTFSNSYVVSYCYPLEILYV